MAQSRSPRAQAIPAEVRVIDDIPVKTGVRVRCLAAKGHEGDARPISGFYVRRRYEGDEFMIPNWEMFSSNWMEFAEEPPADWREKIEARDQRKLEIAAKAAEKHEQPRAEDLMFAMSQMLARQIGRNPNEFDHASGKFKDPADAKVI
jgi:hypothetical protein